MRFTSAATELRGAAAPARAAMATLAPSAPLAPAIPASTPALEERDANARPVVPAGTAAGKPIAAELAAERMRVMQVRARGAARWASLDSSSWRGGHAGCAGFATEAALPATRPFGLCAFVVCASRARVCVCVQERCPRRLTRILLRLRRQGGSPEAERAQRVRNGGERCGEGAGERLAAGQQLASPSNEAARWRAHAEGEAGRGAPS